jgi:predicted RNA-binding Zn ribbon-like protein
MNERKRVTVPADVVEARPPAPGALELVRAFINTRNVERHTDTIDTPDGLTAWLHERGLLDPARRASPEDVVRALEVREVLRTFALRNNGVDCECDARVLNAAAERSGLLLAFDDGGEGTFRPRQPCVDGAIGIILAAVHRAMLDRSWAKLKVCADPTCLWAYYDRSKNGCSRWCNAGLCGNRDKVKRFRERARGAGADSGKSLSNP